MFNWFHNNIYEGVVLIEKHITMLRKEIEISIISKHCATDCLNIKINCRCLIKHVRYSSNISINCHGLT